MKNASASHVDDAASIVSVALNRRETNGCCACFGRRALCGGARRLVALSRIPVSNHRVRRVFPGQWPRLRLNSRQAAAKRGN